MKIATRIATCDDHEFIYDVKKQALGPYINRVWGWNEGFQLAIHRKEFDPSRLLVVTVADHKAGIIEVISNTSCIVLNKLYLQPEYQRQGIGTHLISCILMQAQQRDVPVRLQVLKCNPAQKLYKRLGFVKIKECETHIRMEYSL